MPTNSLTPARPRTVIFFGSSWAQRETWQRLALPPKAYLLVCEAKNKKQFRLMTRVARVVEDKGRKVYFGEPRLRLNRWWDLELRGN